MAKAKEPPLGSFFRLTLAGKESIGVFREVSGLGSETELIEESGVDERGQPVIKKLPGARKWGEITLKRGVDNNLVLWKWRQQVEQEGPDPARLDGTIELLDAGGREISRFNFVNGWPSKVSIGSLQGDVAIETIEITHEGLERT